MALQSTVASIQNIRKQRQLEMELGDLDKKWHVELKVIARERLALVKELCRINEDLKHVDHFQDSVRGKALTRFADKAQSRLLQEKELKEVHKFSFQPDPVDKMNLQLPLIREEGPGEEGKGDVGRVVTSKDLYKQRVQLQKTTSEQCTADRRSRRRPFWDKAIIGSKKRHPFQNRNQFFKATRVPGPVFGPSVSAASQEDDVEDDDEPTKRPALSRSPSLPALNRLSRSDVFRANAVHPSLSKKHSVSMGYLPVISTAREPGEFKPFKAAPLTSRGLPTIVES